MMRPCSLKNLKNKKNKVAQLVECLNYNSNVEGSSPFFVQL